MEKRTGKNKRKTGAGYEQMAAEYLEEKGYRIIGRNVHAGRYGELDLLALKERILAVVEVKFRSGGDFGDPLEAVGVGKQRRMSRSVLYYLSRHTMYADRQLRFDVIAIYGDGTLKHVENAFEFQG